MLHGVSGWDNRRSWRNVGVDLLDLLVIRTEWARLQQVVCSRAGCEKGVLNLEERREKK